MTEDYELATIRNQLLATFTAETFHRLFLYTTHVGLQPVRHRFAPGDGLDDMVDKAITYCLERDLLDDLLREVEKAPTLPTDSPFQVPRVFGRFVGRKKQMDDLRKLLTSGQTATVCGITGLPGIGKSALAAHFAKVYRDSFPDGVLHADFRDHEPFTILYKFAKAYDVDLSKYPDLPTRRDKVRSLLSRKQALIILDNVEDLEDVQELLPSCGERCAVLVTTRDAELAARLANRVVDLPVLSVDESLTLLTALAGKERVEAEGTSDREVCKLLGCLPLAVEIAARLLSLPGWTMGKLLIELGTQHRRLEVLKLGDLEVRTSFQLSYELLDPDQKALFVAIGAFGGLSFDAAAAGAVAGVQEAKSRLYALCHRSLLWLEEMSHFRQHLLLTDFAREKLREQSLEDTLLERHRRYYIAVAEQAQKEKHYDGLDLAWPQFGAACRFAAGRDDQSGVQTVLRLVRATDDARLWDLSIEHTIWLDQGLVCAQRGGLFLEEAELLYRKGLSYIRQGDKTRAREMLTKALEIYKDSEDLNAEQARRLLASLEE